MKVAYYEIMKSKGIKIKKAKPTDIMEAKMRLSNGETCTHSIVTFSPGFEYDEKSCYICGQHLDYV